MKATVHKKYVLDIEDCPRCGEDHEQLYFNCLDNPVEGYDLWTFCPSSEKGNMQPVLASTEEVAD